MNRSVASQHGPHLWEEEDVGLQQGDGDVPGAEGLAQVLDELAGQLGLGLAQGDAFQQRLPGTTHWQSGQDSEWTSSCLKFVDILWKMCGALGRGTIAVGISHPQSDIATNQAEYVRLGKQHIAAMG